MCDKQILKLIKTVLVGKIFDRNMFTAFDVTLMVQEMAKDRGVAPPKHNAIRADIHREMQVALDSGAYTKTSIAVGALAEAFVYYPVESDPQAYVPLSRDKKKVLPHEGVLKTVEIPEPLGERPPYTMLSDSRGSVTVPNALVKACGWLPGDRIYASSASNNRLKLSVSGSCIGESFTSYVVDKYSNIRVTDFALTSAGLEPKKSYSMIKLYKSKAILIY